MDRYKDKHFILPDGTFNNKIIAPSIYADVAIEYGFRYKDEKQILKEDMVIYPSSVFASNVIEAESNSYAIHCCAGSWRDKSFLKRAAENLRKNTTLRKIFRKKPLLTKDVE
jgi:ubiquinone biosynthesis protein Coq4